MIAADIARAIIALSFILIRSPEWVWVAYAGTLLLSVGSAFFDPATAAALPNLCRPGELMTANALQQSTWASGVFVGAALGGVVAQVFGRDAAFVINALRRERSTETARLEFTPAHCLSSPYRKSPNQ